LRKYKWEEFLPSFKILFMIQYISYVNNVSKE